MAFLAIENASSSSSSIPPSSTSGCKYEYDVFLSFRGTDTRNNFTDHLYDRLKQEGIFTFKDDKRLEQGTKINPALLRAIDESRIAVVVLSEHYASSSWCLRELAKIVECMDKKKLTVLPVFHYVDPSYVRNQRGSYAEAFAKHENQFKDDEVKTWRAALTEVANLSGWHVEDSFPESEVIKKIIQRINSELDREVPFVSKHLVGMDSRVKQVSDLCLGERLNCVRLVGICGIGGIGKTTLAREIYNRIFHKFEASSFIANVREESKSQGLVSLQNNLLSEIVVGAEKNISNVEEGKKILRKRLCNKKVLIVLDDVNDDKQLEALAGKDWFGLGSIIIVTSRDRHLLNSYWDGVIDIYIAKGLNDDEALELFSLKAFKKPRPQENYVDLSINFVSYANGLPLALTVLGPSLFGKTLDEWRSARAKLEAKPNRVIMDVLEMSFVGLDDTQRDLFLDIAFLFKDTGNHFSLRRTLQILGHYTYDIGVLRDKSLITIDSNGDLAMHDLLKEMGQEIVRRESLEEPGRRSRLWSYEDALHVLKSNAGTEVVKSIMLNMPIEAKERLSAEAFSKMKNLRFLKIGYVDSLQDLIRGPIQLPQGLSYLSNKLRILDWYGYPLKSLPTSFQPNKLVELKMRYSDIKELWKGTMILNELKLIDLSGSQNLTEIPDLSGAPNLEYLILQRCTRLCTIHASLGDLKRLIELDLDGCKCLKILPHKINLEARRNPDLMGTLERNLIGLCSNSLTSLKLSYCNIQTIPNVLGCLPSLEYLDLQGNDFVSLPESIIELSNLRNLKLGGCTHLQMLPKLPLNIRHIDAAQCASLETLSLRPEFDFRPMFHLPNCDKLFKNQGAGDLFSTMLPHYVQGQQDEYYVMIHGSEIPKWFTHQNVGASVNLQVPSDLSCNKYMGIALCAVFEVRKHDPNPAYYFLNHGYKIAAHVLGYSISIGGFEKSTFRVLSEEFGKIKSYHLCLQYIPSTCFGADWEEILNQVDNDGFSQIEVKFKSKMTDSLSPALEVTKCGAHLVSERVIEDLINQTKAGPSSCIITPYDEDGFEDSEKDTKIKRSRDDSDGEGAGPSGEATSNDVDEPHTKRIRLPNLGNWLGNSSTQEQGDSDCEEEKSQ